MIFLSRKDLYEALTSLVVCFIAICFAYYCESNIKVYFGGSTGVILFVADIICFSYCGGVINAWILLREQEQIERNIEAEERRQERELERERQAEQAEWIAFTNWVKKNPKTAERLLVSIENEQIEDFERRAWNAERRESKGPDVLVDLPRLFDWLKAQRELKKTGLDAGLPPDWDR